MTNNDCLQPRVTRVHSGTTLDLPAWGPIQTTSIIVNFENVHNIRLDIEDGLRNQFIAWNIAALHERSSGLKKIHRNAEDVQGHDPDKQQIEFTAPARDVKSLLMKVHMFLGVEFNCWKTTFYMALQYGTL